MFFLSFVKSLLKFFLNLLFAVIRNTLMLINKLLHLFKVSILEKLCTRCHINSTIGNIFYQFTNNIAALFFFLLFFNLRQFLLFLFFFFNKRLKLFDKRLFNIFVCFCPGDRSINKRGIKIFTICFYKFIFKFFALKFFNIILFIISRQNFLFF